MAVPKRKTSKRRKSARRAANFRLNSPKSITCKTCGHLKKPHVVCPNCGK